VSPPIVCRTETEQIVKRHLGEFVRSMKSGRALEEGAIE
jgi:hypothetical protein